MIKFALRRNLIYPLQYLIFSVIRDTETDLLDCFYKFDYPLILTLLMFIGEFLEGLIIYLYQKKITTKKPSPMDIKLASIILQRKLKTVDNNSKIMFLIFCAGLMDFVQFLLSLHIPKLINISSSIGLRLRGFLTIFDALYYYYALRLPIFRHELFSLCGIGICLIIIIIIEFIFQEFNIFISLFQLIINFLFILVEQFCRAMIDSTEKYLFEYNNINPFYALLLEGVFGFILSFLYGVFENPIYYTAIYKNIKSTQKLSILIVSLIMFIILSGFKNIFRVQTTKIYSPMTTTLIDYAFNPIYLIIYFSLNEDFLTKGKKNYAYFFVNFFMALFITILGFIYNEFIIIYFCALEKDTYLEVSKRANLNNENEKEYIAMKNLEESEEEKTVL